MRLRAGKAIDIRAVLRDLHEILEILLNEVGFVLGPDGLIVAFVFSNLLADL